MIKPLLNASTIVALEDLLSRATYIVITCHKTPDGDALGSMLALCRVLRNMGKYVDVVAPDMVPRSLMFVPMANKVVSFTTHENSVRSIVGRAGLVFCLDYNSMQRIDRLGEVINSCRAPRVLLDHHLDPDVTAFDVMISYPNLSSTCEIVYRVIREMNWRRYMDRVVAQYIYLGMMTDTGNFTYSSDYPEVYNVLAELMTYDINKQDIYNKAMNTFSESSLRIQGYAISQKMHLFAEQGCALIVLNRKELEQYGYKRGDTEGLVNKPLSIPGIFWVVFLREDVDNIKVSCRSQGDFSVSDICRDHFGGGGHKNAAGGEFHGTIEEAESCAIEIIKNIKIDNTNNRL